MRPYPTLYEFSTTGDFFDEMFMIYQDNQEIQLVAWQPEKDWQTSSPPVDTIMRVYRMRLPDDVLEEYDWAVPDDVAKSLGVEPEELRARGVSTDPIVRAHALYSLVSYYGWEEFDHSPLRLTALELHERWGDDPRNDPRLDLLDETFDKVLVDFPGQDLTAQEIKDLQKSGKDRLYAAMVSADMGGWDFWKALGDAAERFAKIRDANYERRDRSEDGLSASVNQLTKMTYLATPPPGTVCIMVNPRGGHRVVKQLTDGKWKEESADE